MKKIPLVISALLLCIFCFSSCNETDGNRYIKAVKKDPSPENVYNLVSSSAERLKNSGAYSANATVNISFTVKGIKTSYEMTFLISKNGDGYYIESDLGKMGGKARLTLIDGTMYCYKNDTEGVVKYKTNMTKEDFEEESIKIILCSYSFEPSSDSLPYDINDVKSEPKDFEKADVLMEEDGITVTLDILGIDSLSGIVSGLASGIADEKADLSKASASITIDNNENIVGGSVVFSADSESDGEKISVSVTANATFENPGEAPVIAVPDDADNYEEHLLGEKATEAYATYKEAMKKLVDDGAYSVDVKDIFKTESSSTTVEQHVDLNKDKFYSYTIANGKVVKITLVDGVLYVYNDGEKYKYSIDFESASNQYGVRNGGMYHFRRLDFEGAFVTVGEAEGEKIIHLTSDKITELAEATFKSAFSGHKTAVTKASLTIAIDKDGNVTGETYKFDGTVTSGSSEIKVSITITEAINGDDPKVLVPYYPEQYIEINA